MNIECPECKILIQTADEHAGKRGRCKCGKVFRIPKPPEIVEIYCLSVQQPFADFLFVNKWAENRSWKTNYRGEIWIHSSKIATEVVADYLKDGIDLAKKSRTGLMTGVILGRANLVECVTREELLTVAPDEYLELIEEERPEPTENSERLGLMLQCLHPETWLHVAKSDFVWILAEQQMLEQPIPYSGRQGIWRAAVPKDSLQLASRRKRKWKPIGID